jgi:DNA modification methylase
VSEPRIYFEDESVQLWLGDCRDVPARLGAESVDLVLADPPYGVGYVSSRRTRSDPLVVPVIGDESLNTLRDALPLMDRLLRPDRHAYLFAAALRIGECLDAIGEYWRIKNVVIWDKGEAGSVGDLNGGYAWNWEPIVYAAKGRRDLNGPRPRAIYRYDWQGTRDPVHPTQKPVGLMQWLIQKSTNPGDTILDPFAGSGPVLRAAKNLGRKVVACEVKEEYCEAAARRLRQQVLPLEMAG